MYWRRLLRAADALPRRRTNHHKIIILGKSNNRLQDLLRPACLELQGWRNVMRRSELEMRQSDVDEAKAFHLQ